MSFRMLTLLLFCFLLNLAQAQDKYALVIHGGAGNITPENVPEEAAAKYRQKLEEALQAGNEILQKGGTSLDAVQKVITILEDSPLFNAGKGAVFTNALTNEMDASIMDGSDLNAGAVAGINGVKNPIKAARLVMGKSPHVLLSGEGAVQYAKSEGLEIVDSTYFRNDRRYQQIKQIKAKEGLKEDRGALDSIYSDWKFGTVGAVALDEHGNLAAATSTGGMTNKRYGRIGDSPIIGAGTYANNTTCAISCTGHGEYFMRYLVAYDVSALMAYANMSLDEAAKQVIHEKLENAGGTGGLIGLDAEGNMVMPFNTAGMFRGFINSDGDQEVYLFGKE